MLLPEQRWDTGGGRRTQVRKGVYYMLKEPILLTEDSVRYAMLGGSILGGGGGGAAESGGQTGRLAVQFRDLYLTPLDEIDPDAVIVTASMVGAPAAKERYVAPAVVT